MTGEPAAQGESGWSRPTGEETPRRQLGRGEQALGRLLVRRDFPLRAPVLGRRVREAGLPILEPAHPLELLLHAPPHLQRELESPAHIIRHELAVGMDELETAVRSEQSGQ